MKNLKDLAQLSTPLIGVDEVGRGCLAGPVTAGAVIFKSEIDIKKYRDSKSLTAVEREELAQSIRKNHIVSLGWATVEEIDELNILQATFLAMQRAIKGLKKKNGSILVDGRDQIPNMGPFTQRAIIKGDQKLRLIAAASIVAKVARDDFMKKLAGEFTAYGFEKHKGYGTLYHRQQIQSCGPCRWHRKSFGGVKEFVR